MSYIEARKRLLALPVENQRLIGGDYYRSQEDCYCALGAVLPAITNEPLWTNYDIESLADDHPSVRLEIKELGMTMEEAKALQAVNDGIGSEQCSINHLNLSYNSPEMQKERFRKVVNWMADQDKKRGF